MIASMPYGTRLSRGGKGVGMTMLKGGYYSIEGAGVLEHAFVIGHDPDGIDATVVNCAL